MGILHYANFELLSVYPVEWMIYYKHHRYMADPQYVCVDVTSGYPAQ
jgi:hypothetical protein